MASKQIKTCDITGSTKDVKTFNITVEQCGATEEENELVRQVNALDMGPRALKRLLEFVDRGVSKPVKKEKKVAAAAS